MDKKREAAAFGGLPALLIWEVGVYSFMPQHFLYFFPLPQGRDRCDPIPHTAGPCGGPVGDLTCAGQVNCPLR